jgi:hypothetical protein
MIRRAIYTSKRICNLEPDLERIIQEAGNMADSLWTSNCNYSSIKLGLRTRKNFVLFLSLCFGNPINVSRISLSDFSSHRASPRQIQKTNHHYRGTSQHQPKQRAEGFTRSLIRYMTAERSSEMTRSMLHHLQST